MANAAKTVLVVDDDVSFAYLTASIIDCAEYRAVIATDGTEAVRMAREITPALVLCDLSMPGLGGVEVLRLLQDDPSTANIPRVLMSGYACPSLRGVAADAFIAKPFKPEALRRLVRAFTQPRAIQVVQTSLESSVD